MKLIDKAALVAEIKRRLKFVEKRLKKNNSYSEEGNAAWERDKALYDAYNSLLHFSDTIEVKEVDLNLDNELDKYIKNNNAFIKDDFVVEKNNGDSFNHIYDLESVAKHFFELGIKFKSSYVSTPNIDDTLKEMGVDPDSKEANSFKNSYYKALDKFKEKKGK